MKYCETCHSSYPGDFTTCPKDQSTLRSITELMPGLILREKYEILERLGAGGMGTVYRARHIAFGEMRAIKVIDSHLIHDDEFLARFRGEAVLARKLLHPNVVRVEDLDSTEDGRPFIVMEYVVGRSLRDVLRQEPGLAQARAVDIVAQACSALAAAHALGILHRDMKPENLMLVPQPDGGDLVKVLDFGLAKVLEGFQGAGQGVSTQTGMVVGTPEYISPEQAVPTQGLALDERSDLYSLGVVLYELLTGHLPFVADTPMGMVLHHLQTLPEPPHEAHPDRGIPPALSALVMKALAKDREARFSSADEMRQALLLLAPGLPTSPAVASTPDAHLADTSVRTPGDALSHAPTPATVVVPTRPEGAERPAATTPVQPSPPTVARPAPYPTRTTLPGATAVSPPAGGDARKSRLWLYASLLAIVTAFWLGISRSGQSPPTPGPTPSADDHAASGERQPAVAPATGERTGDDAVLADVQRLIAGSSALRDARIEIAVANGIVTLSGEAPTTTARDLAVSLAGTAHGVNRVFNMVEVTPAVAAAPPAATASPAPAQPAASLPAPPPHP